MKAGEVSSMLQLYTKSLDFNFFVVVTWRVFGWDGRILHKMSVRSCFVHVRFSGFSASCSASA